MDQVVVVELVVASSEAERMSSVVVVANLSVLVPLRCFVTTSLRSAMEL